MARLADFGRIAGDGEVLGELDEVATLLLEPRLRLLEIAHLADELALHFLQQLLVELHLRDVGIERDGAAVGEAALLDEEPAAVGELALEIGRQFVDRARALAYGLLGVGLAEIEDAALDHIAHQVFHARAGNHQVALIAEGLAQAVVAQHQPPVLVPEGEAVGHRRHRLDEPCLGAPRARFALARRRLGQLLAADVEGDAVPYDAAVLAAMRLRRAPHPAHLAVGHDDAEVDLPGLQRLGGVFE